MAFLLSTAGDLPSIVGTASAVNSDLVAQCDTSNYSAALFQLYGTFVGTVTFQGSVEDVPTNWINLTAMNITSGASGVTAAAAGLFYVPLTCKWFRVRVTAYTSGTLNSTAVFSLDDIPNLQATSSVVSGTVSLAAGSANIGYVYPSATIGAANAEVVSRVQGAASGVIKATLGRIYGYALLNTNAAARYLQIYNKATAGVPGTDTPSFTIPLAANGALADHSTIGIYQATGLSWAITTDAAGVTAGASGDVVGTVFYI